MTEAIGLFASETALLSLKNSKLDTLYRHHVTLDREEKLVLIANVTRLFNNAIAGAQ